VGLWVLQELQGHQEVLGPEDHRVIEGTQEDQDQMAPVDHQGPQGPQEELDLWDQME